jgi:hypothetical protein
MAEENTQVDAATARTFVSEFVPDPKVIEGMDDQAVIAYHGRVTGALDKVRPVSGKWPEKWREELAGGEEKEAERLKRFQAPGDIYKSYRALEQKISSGELKPNAPFPEKGTDAEKNAWRQAQGIPESPEKYEVKLPDGLVIGEADKPFVEAFLKDAHAAHMPPAAANAAITSYFKMQEQRIAQAKEGWDETLKSTEDALRNEWGQDYRKNIGHLEAHLADSIGDEGLRTKVLNGIKSDPGFAKYMMAMVLQVDPVGTVVTGDGQTQLQAITDEVAGLKKLMGDQNSEYWKGPKAAANQARYRELVAAQDKLKKK